jgi:tetratricopeptide (TPR) repeat protein
MKPYFKKIFLLLVPFVLYIGSAQFEFTYFDDNQLIIGNSKQFEAPFSLNQYFLTGADVSSPSVYYRPLQNLSYHIDTWLAGGIEPWMFHLSNVFLFAFLILCLYYFLVKLGIKESYAFGLSLLYAVHPVNVCAAAWIPARGDLQLVIFVLLSFTAFISFMQTRKWRYAMGAALTFGFALLSKETAAILPVLFLLYYGLNVPNKKLEYKHWVFAAMLFIVGGSWFYLRTVVVISNAHMSCGTFFANWQHFPSALTQWTLPYYWNTLPIYTMANTVLGSLLLLGLIYWVIKVKNKLNYLGICWFTLFMIPLFLVLPCDFDYLEHRFLLPLIGVVIIMGVTIPTLHIPSRILNGSFVGLLLILSVLSYQKSQNYQDPEIFYTEAIIYNPSGLPYQNRGLYRQNKGNLQGALEDYNEAVKVEPRSITAPLTRGIIKGQMGDFKGGIEDINRSIAIADTSYDQFFQRGYLEEQLGDVQSAIADYNKALQMKPDFFLAYNNRGSMKERMGDKEGALQDFSAAIRYNPDFAQAYSNTALIYYQYADYAQALHYLDLAIRHAQKYDEKQLYESRKQMVVSRMQQ